MAEYDKENCPLKFATDKLSVSTYPCDEERCAWWHILNIQTKRGQCSLLTLAVALHWISVKDVK